MSLQARKRLMILNEAGKGKMVVAKQPRFLEFPRGGVIMVLLFFFLHLVVRAIGEKLSITAEPVEKPLNFIFPIL